MARRSARCGLQGDVCVFRADTDRLTFVKLAGVDGARKISDELVDTSLAAIATLGRDAQPLRDLATYVRGRVR